IFFLIYLRLHIFTLFPYTTLFRSFKDRPASVVKGLYEMVRVLVLVPGMNRVPAVNAGEERFASHLLIHPLPASRASLGRVARERSEEHTSELQSRSDLVCRLLLEK